MTPRRPRALEAGLFLLVVALPLGFFPLSRNAFLDVKLLLLAGGSLLVWASGLPVDRRIALAASVWIGVLVVAALAGVDPVESLVGTVRATGLVMLVCAASLVAIAPGIPSDLLERVRGWVVWSGVLVAGVLVIERLAPAALDAVAPGLNFGGSTFGNPVDAIGFFALCVPAALAARGSPTWRTVAVFAVLGAGFALAEERSAYLLPLVALAATAWFVRPGWRRLGTAAMTIAAVLVLWAMLPAATIDGGPSDRFTAVGQFQTLEGERQRVAVYGANLRAVAERPVLGWGPANAWTGFLSAGTEEQIQTAGRNWADAHNIVLELAVISGVVGLAAFGWLVIRVAPRALRPPPDRRWLAAAAVTLGVFALVEPLDIVLTPLLFLFAGAAAGGRVAEPAPARSTHVGGRIARGGAAAALAAATVLATVNVTASALEQWGHSHYATDWALRAATRVAPWRITASEALAVSLAIDGRAGNEAAAAEARDVVLGVVEDHPSNPGVRLLAADVELLLRNLPGTQAWIREHLERFPNDSIRVPAAEPETTLFDSTG